jgi:hypothetical protein
MTYNDALRNTEAVESSADQQSLWVPYPVARDSPVDQAEEMFLYNHRDRLTSLFYDVRDTMRMRGLMSNSEAPQLVDIVMRSCRFSYEDPPSSSEDEDEGMHDDEQIIDVRERRFEYI